MAINPQHFSQVDGFSNRIWSNDDGDYINNGDYINMGSRLVNTYSRNFASSALPHSHMPKVPVLILFSSIELLISNNNYKAFEFD